jgi:hypothetical protein
MARRLLREFEQNLSQKLSQGKPYAAGNSSRIHPEMSRGFSTEKII